MSKPKPVPTTYNLRIDEGENERLLLDARAVRAEKIQQLVVAYLTGGISPVCDLRIRVARNAGRVEGAAEERDGS